MAHETLGPGVDEVKGWAVSQERKNTERGRDNREGVK